MKVCMFWRCISDMALWKRTLMSVEALWTFWRFQALEISLPPTMNMIPRITRTASSSIRLKPLRPRGRGAYESGRSGSKRLIM